MYIYFETTVKPVLNRLSRRRPKIGFQERLSLNAGQKYCRMLQESILQYFRSTFIKLPLVFKTFILSIFDWPLKTGFTVVEHENLMNDKHIYIFQTTPFGISKCNWCNEGG